MEEYKIEARASVPYAMYIKASSDEEARNIAEEKAKSYHRTAMERANPDICRAYPNDITNSYDSWSMRVDDFGLEIESVSRVYKMRPFIPGFDD